MTAAKLKLKIEQGATFRKPFIWKSGLPPVPVDLTGYTARMQIRADLTSDTVIANLNTENDGITIGVDGEFSVFISDVDTSLMDFDEAVYDIELIAPNGDVRRIVEGVVTLSREVTRND